MSTERQIGMGVGPIPSSKVREYASDILGFDPDGDEAREFSDIIRRMDSEERSASSKLNDPKTREVSTVPIDDVSGVTQLFAAIESRNKNERAAKKKGADGP